MRTTYFYVLCAALPLLTQSAWSQPTHYRFQPFSPQGASAGETVRTLFQDTRGYIWLGLDSEGLCKYDGSTYEVYGNEGDSGAGIASSYLNDIEEDRFGNIWVATNQGLNVLWKKDRSIDALQLG